MNNEEEEENIISFKVSVPPDVIVQRGDVREAVSVIVKYSSVSD